MTANDATMNFIIWIHNFWLKPLFNAFKLIDIRYYHTHEGDYSHMTSVQVYLYTS